VLIVWNKAWIVGCCVSFASSAFSQVIPVEFLSAGFFGARQTMTMLHESSDAALTVVVVMGHPGSFGLKAGDSFVKNTTARMMRDLVYRPKIKAHVVILDSPAPLHGVGARSSKDHLDRMDSVLKFYEDKLKVPIWLFGHSDGSISVSEYMNRPNTSRRSVSGVILSAGRDETRIKEDWKIPALVIHHEKDGCDVTTFNGAQRYFKQIQQTNTAAVEFAAVVGGVSSGPPCSTGHHMYEGAFGETLGLIEDFLSQRH
jgi:hypothetical protein